MVSLIPALLACSTMNLGHTHTDPGTVAPTQDAGKVVAAAGEEPARAERANDPATASLHAKPRLVAEHHRLVAGQTNTLAIIFEIDAHWHLYWPGMNDSGMPASAEFELPAGFIEEPWQWPAPHKRQVLPGEIVDHIYEDRVAILVPIAVPADAKPGPVTISADLQWLVCEEACVLESATLKLHVDVVASADAPPSQRPKMSLDDDHTIEKTRARVPTALPAEAEGNSPDGVLHYHVFRHQTGLPVLSLKAEKAQRIAFYPQEGCLPLGDRIGGTLAEGDALAIQFTTPSRGFAEAGESSSGIRGVIEVRILNDPASRFYRIALPFPSGNAGQLTPSPSHPSTPNR